MSLTCPRRLAPGCDFQQEKCQKSRLAGNLPSRPNELPRVTQDNPVPQTQGAANQEANRGGKTALLRPASGSRGSLPEETSPWPSPDVLHVALGFILSSEGPSPQPGDSGWPPSCPPEARPAG